MLTLHYLIRKLVMIMLTLCSLVTNQNAVFTSLRHQWPITCRSWSWSCLLFIKTEKVISFMWVCEFFQFLPYCTHINEIICNLHFFHIFSLSSIQTHINESLVTRNPISVLSQGSPWPPWPWPRLWLLCDKLYTPQVIFVPGMSKLHHLSIQELLFPSSQ